MEKITAIRVKHPNNTFSDEIPIGVLAQNIDWDNTKNLKQILGNVDIDNKGSIQQQINNIASSTVLKSEIDSELSSSSINPVQNRIITQALDSKVNISDIPDIPGKTSDLMNDSGFVTRNEVQTMISSVDNQTGNINQNIASISQQINQLKQAFNEQIHMEIDSALDSTSENPVKNQVIAARINDIENRINPLEDNISNHSTKIEKNEEDIQKCAKRIDVCEERITALAGNTTIDWNQAEGNINATIKVDSELKSDSAYPVQNRVIKQALDSQSDRIGSLENSISNINTSIENIPENLSDLTNDLNLSFVSIDEQTNTIVIQDVT